MFFVSWKICHSRINFSQFLMKLDTTIYSSLFITFHPLPHLTDCPGNVDQKNPLQSGSSNMYGRMRVSSLTELRTICWSLAPAHPLSDAETNFSTAYKDNKCEKASYSHNSGRPPHNSDFAHTPWADTFVYEGFLPSNLLCNFWPLN